MISESLPLTAITGPLVLYAVSVTALVIADLRGSRPGRYLFKPLAAAAFVWLALALGATGTTYGNWMLLALVLCLLGDLLLMPDSQRSFLAGLGAFLCGHLVFAVAFAHLGDNVTGAVISALPATVLLVVVARWLTPHVPAKMKIPVAMYVVVICAMLVFAGLTVGHPAASWVIAGAWAFAASDIAVARRQFIDPSRRNALWGTPLYFSAQMILAASIAFVS